MISSARITIKNYRCFVDPVSFDLRKGFTAFVGANNAGKSTVMRFLLEFRQLFSRFSEARFLYESMSQEVSFGECLHVLDQEEVFSNLNENPISLMLEVFPERALSLRAHIAISRSGSVRTELFVDEDQIFRTIITGVGSDHFTKRSGGQIDLVELLKAFRSLASTLYIGPFRNTVNVGSNANYLDIRIGTSFIEHFRSLKTGPSKRENEGVSRLIDQIRRIFRFESLDISPTADNSSLHFTVNNKPFKQHELGSGLSQFVIVLANAAVAKPDWILIDEPELNLHPALQFEFLTVLGSYATEGVWFSTHSIGLARRAAEKIHSVSRISEGNSIVRSLPGTPRLAEFLGELSFASQKELGFEKILLVEGPTEVKVIQRFLRSLSKDHSILPLPIHGHMPRRDELEELMRITSNISVLIDSEKSSRDAPLDKSRAELGGICEACSIKFLALELGATENYFPDDAVKKVFGPTYRALKPYEKLNQINPRWGKNQNWKVAEATSFEQIAETDFGRFLRNL